MQPITADQIAKAIDGRFMAGSPETVVSSVSINSREIAPGALFVPIVGERVDAHQFIPAALEARRCGNINPKGAHHCAAVLLYPGKRHQRGSAGPGPVGTAGSLPCLWSALPAA